MKSEKTLVVESDQHKIFTMLDEGWGLEVIVHKQHMKLKIELVVGAPEIQHTIFKNVHVDDSLPTSWVEKLNRSEYRYAMCTCIIFLL